MRLAIMPLLTAFLLTTAPAFGAGKDEDLRQAAKLHRGGETPAAVTLWEKWAKAGDADAAYNLALIHEFGDGVAQDDARALAWYKVAAEQGDKPAQFRIGLMYQNGQGVAADPEEAHRWFTAHLKHHLHHEHDPRMVAWRKEALALIEERDRREALAHSRREGARILAELQERARGQASRDEASPTAIALR